MDADSLQFLSAMTMTGGLALAGLGGFGSWYFSRAARDRRELDRASAELKLNAKLETLQRANDELRRQIELFEMAVSKAPVASPVKATVDAPMIIAPEQEAEFSLLLTEHPAPVPMKAPPPPLKSAETTGWDGASILEEMIASTMEPQKESALGEKQRREMVKVLRRHPGGSIDIQSVAGDAESPGFAEVLRSTFMEAGWEVGSVNEIAYAKPPVGLSVSTTFPTPDESVAASWALAAAGIRFTQQHDSKLMGDKTVLLVGADVKQAI